MIPHLTGAVGQPTSPAGRGGDKCGPLYLALFRVWVLGIDSDVRLSGSVVSTFTQLVLSLSHSSFFLVMEGDKVSLCSPARSASCYVDQASLKLVLTSPSLPCEHWNRTHVQPAWLFIYF